MKLFAQTLYAVLASARTGVREAGTRREISRNRLGGVCYFCTTLQAVTALSPDPLDTRAAHRTLRGRVISSSPRRSRSRSSRGPAHKSTHTHTHPDPSRLCRARACTPGRAATPGIRNSEPRRSRRPRDRRASSARPSSPPQRAAPPPRAPHSRSRRPASPRPSRR